MFIQFNHTTAEDITNQIRTLLTGKRYEFSVIHYRYKSLCRTSVEQLSPEDTFSGDALSLSLKKFAFLTVSDTYGVWQIAEGDAVEITNDQILVAKYNKPAEWKISILAE